MMRRFYPEYFKAFCRCRIFCLLFCEESDLEAINLIDSSVNFYATPIRFVWKLLFVCGVVMSAGVTCNAVTGTSPSVEYVIVMSNILVGVFSAEVFTIAYASAKEASMNTEAEMRNKENEITLTKRSMINRGQYGVL
jgi:hypothetical protein